MTIKTILVPVPAGAFNQGVLRTALMAARALEAHVHVLYIDRAGPAASASALPTNMEIPRYAGASGTYQPPAPSNDGNGRERFTALCREHDVPVIDGRGDGTLPSASWEEQAGAYVEVAAERAPAYDLTVAGSAAVADAEKEIAEASVLKTGRPVLLSSLKADQPLDGSVLIAWTPAVSCWRAVSAAMPFLQRAEKVEVVTVDKDRDAESESREAVTEYLRWHGVGAESRVVVPPTRQIDGVIFSQANEMGAGLIVTGAYSSHGKLHESIFGGVTRSILSNAAATPVLMAH